MKKPKPLSKPQPEFMSQPIQEQMPEPMGQQLESVASQEQSAITSEADAAPDFTSIEADLGGTIPQQSPEASGFLTKDQFFAGFGGAFTMASAITRLDSLAIDDKDKMAREASDAIYDTAMEIPMFHFMVRPGNVYVQRALVIMVFGKTKMDAVKAEVMMKRAALAQSANAQPVASMAPTPASDPTSAYFGKAAA